MEIPQVLKQIFNAEEILREWWGDGGHPDPRAQDRADICTGRLSGKACPYNYRGGWIVPQKIADSIRRVFEVKNKLKLEVEAEASLGHCEICNCVLSLKVHVPTTHILNKTPPEELSKFPEWCWIRMEQKETNQT